MTQPVLDDCCGECEIDEENECICNFCEECDECLEHGDCTCDEEDTE